MSNVFSTGKVMSAVDMSQFGIDTVVLTEHDEMGEIMRRFATAPDTVWCGGRGKKYLHKMLRKQLFKEDKFFTKNPKEIQRNSQRWSDFCDDCVNFATLNALLFDQPVYLLHPQCYEEQVAQSPFNATSGEMPTLIEDIYTLQ